MLFPLFIVIAMRWCYFFIFFQNLGQGLCHSNLVHTFFPQMQLGNMFILGKINLKLILNWDKKGFQFVTANEVSVLVQGFARCAWLFQTAPSIQLLVRSCLWNSVQYITNGTLLLLALLTSHCSVALCCKCCSCVSISSLSVAWWVDLSLAFSFIPLCLLLWVLIDCRVEDLLSVFPNVCWFFFVLFVLLLLLRCSLPWHRRKHPS